MNSNLFFCILLAISVFAFGCRRESGVNIKAEQRTGKIYTEDELNKLITPGMEAAEVTNKFGRPSSQIKMGPDTILLV